MADSTRYFNAYNVVLTLADTEYSLLLPSGLRDIRFRCRTLYDIRYSFVTGKVAGSVDPFLTLPAGSDYVSDDNDLSGNTIYFASSQAGVVVEIEVWT